MDNAPAHRRTGSGFRACGFERAQKVTAMLAVTIAFTHLPQSAEAMTLDEQAKALQIIADYAARMCDTVPIEGNGENVELNGTAKAELSALIKKVVDLGGQASVSYLRNEYKNVLQKDLADSLKDSRDCKRDINRQLMQRLLPIEPAVPPTAPMPPASKSQRRNIGTFSFSIAPCDKFERLYKVEWPDRLDSRRGGLLGAPKGFDFEIRGAPRNPVLTVLSFSELDQSLRFSFSATGSKWLETEYNDAGEVPFSIGGCSSDVHDKGTPVELRVFAYVFLK